MSGCRVPGGCSTTAIRLGFTSAADPTVSAPKQVLQEWLNLLDELQPQKASLELAWRRLVQQLSTAKSRWGRVRGPVSAVVATLLDLGWRPLGPACWKDTDGEEFNLLTGDRDRLVDFALEGALEQRAWRRAAAFHLGGGLEDGVDLTVLRRHLAQLRRQARHAEARILELVAMGGLWPAARRFGSDEVPLPSAPAGSSPASPPQDGSQMPTALGFPASEASAVCSPHGQQVLTAFDASDCVASAVFSPDGRQVLTASGAPASEVISAVFSPDGQQVLFASDDSDRPASAVFSPDGQQVLTACGSSSAADALLSSDGQQALTASAAEADKAPAAFDDSDVELDFEHERACEEEYEAEIGAGDCERDTITWEDARDTITSDPIIYSQFHTFNSAGQAV